MIDRLYNCIMYIDIIIAEKHLKGQSIEQIRKDIPRLGCFAKKNGDCLTVRLGAFKFFETGLKFVCLFLFLIC